MSKERGLEEGTEEEEEPKRACRASSVEFSLANLPAVELCRRRAVIKSQSGGKEATGLGLPILRRSKREEAFAKPHFC